MSSAKQTRRTREPAQPKTKATKDKRPVDPQSPWEVFQLVAEEMKKNGPVFNKPFEEVLAELHTI